jgi:hypothetical protein
MSAEPAFSSRIPSICPPYDWPFREQGAFMAHLGRVLVVRLDEPISARVFERHLVELGRQIDLRADDQRNAVLYDVPWLSSMDAVRRRQVATLLNARKEKLGRTTLAFSLVTASKLVRGALEAIFWVAPPAFPVRVVETSSEGFRFLSTFAPELDARSYDAEYQRQLGRASSGVRPAAR